MVRKTLLSIYLSSLMWFMTCLPFAGNKQSICIKLRSLKLFAMLLLPKSWRSSLLCNSKWMTSIALCRFTISWCERTITEQKNNQLPNFLLPSLVGHCLCWHGGAELTDCISEGQLRLFLLCRDTFILRFQQIASVKSSLTVLHQCSVQR